MLILNFADYESNHKKYREVMSGQDNEVGERCAYLLSGPHQLQLNYRVTVIENRLKSR